MNKTELVNAIAAKEGIEKKCAEKAVNAVVAAISDALAAGEKVQLIGFGTFEVRARAAKEARNPEQAKQSRLQQLRFPLSRQALLLRQRLLNKLIFAKAARMGSLFISFIFRRKLCDSINISKFQE